MEKIQGRVCSVKGTIDQNSKAIKLIYETVMTLETNLNGIRIEK